MTVGKPSEQQSKTMASETEKDLEGSTPSSTPAPSELEAVVTVKTWVVTFVSRPKRPANEEIY